MLKKNAVIYVGEECRMSQEQYIYFSAKSCLLDFMLESFELFFMITKQI